MTCNFNMNICWEVECSYCWQNHLTSKIENFFWAIKYWRRCWKTDHLYKSQSLWQINLLEYFIHYHITGAESDIFGMRQSHDCEKSLSRKYFSHDHEEILQYNLLWTKKLNLLTISTDSLIFNNYFQIQNVFL